MRPLAILAAPVAALALTAAPAVAQEVSGSTLAGRIDSQCGRIEYEADCFSALRRALAEAEGMSDEELEPIRETLAGVMEDNPNQAEDIREIVTESGVALGEI
ncbi:hypothetical protein [Roseitranquillus sediminis]|uniref:hypothetical protein n=1 Tax=Roseitranquillus sediminis TaxID=2809051 RepID=UPI001D0C1F3E|nr:hypothetical protein [Roseitranquillus sediminis]MBM9596010.1 hypothetical protein [Roseitranquillus sediminis]